MAIGAPDADIVDQHVDRLGLQLALQPADVTWIGDVQLDELDPVLHRVRKGVETLSIGGMAGSVKDLVAPACISLHQFKPDAAIGARDKDARHRRSRR
jgi:hypothetical protein